VKGYNISIYLNDCKGIKNEVCIEPINRNKVHVKPMKGTRNYCAMKMFLAYMREPILEKGLSKDDKLTLKMSA